MAARREAHRRHPMRVNAELLRIRTNELHRPCGIRHAVREDAIGIDAVVQYEAVVAQLHEMPRNRRALGGFADHVVAATWNNQHRGTRQPVRRRFVMQETGDGRPTRRGGNFGLVRPKENLVHRELTEKTVVVAALR